MKIVHCFFSLHIGGAEVLAIDMMNEMCVAHEVILIIVNNWWDEIMIKELNPRIKVYYIKRTPRSLNPLPVLKFNWLLRKLKPDVFHSHTNKIINLIKFGRYKTVFTVHDVGHENIGLTKYNAIVSISASVAHDIKSRFNIDSTIIYNGIPINRFVKRANYTLGNDQTFKLVQLGRVVHTKKGHDILINAVHKLISSNQIQHLSLDIIGSGKSTGKSEPYLKQLVADLNLTASVKFLGERDREWLNKNLCQYHALVQPSRYEGFGLTVVEGIAAGLPVAASAIEGPAEIMEGMKTNFLFSLDNVEACADTLKIIFDAYTKSNMKEIVDDMYNVVENRFTLEKMVNQYLLLYKQISE
jgi:glycosyltransferase involved in cell wall biosynthesis